jgi:hypothetical protein
VNVNILGRAPSLASVTRASLLDGPVLAINGAVMHKAVPADYLVSCDGPAWLGDEEIPGEPVVVTRAANRHTWFDRKGHLWLVTYDDAKRLADCLPWKTRLDGRQDQPGTPARGGWDHWSMLLALYHAYRLGATRIRFGGVSMRGDTYAYSERRVDYKLGPEQRWARERREVAQAMTELGAEAGIEFDLPLRCEQYRCDACGLEYALSFAYGAMSCECNAGALVAGVSRRDGPGPLDRKTGRDVYQS